MYVLIYYINICSRSLELWTDVQVLSTNIHQRGWLIKNQCIFAGLCTICICFSLYNYNFFSFVSRNAAILRTIEDVCYYPGKCLAVLLLDQPFHWSNTYKENLINVLTVTGSKVHIMSPYCADKSAKVVNIWKKSQRRLFLPKTVTTNCDPLAGTTGCPNKQETWQKTWGQTFKKK